MWDLLPSALRDKDTNISKGHITSIFRTTFVMRPTVNRPVRLGVVILLERVTRCYISLSDNYFNFFHVRRPLWREDGSVICSAMTQVQVQIILLPRSVGQFVLLQGPQWGPWPDFNFFVWQLFSSSRSRAPSPISPMNRVIQPKVKIKSQRHVIVGRYF
jgi:hypothetical protein